MLRKNNDLLAEKKERKRKTPYIVGAVRSVAEETPTAGTAVTAETADRHAKQLQPNISRRVTGQPEIQT